MREIDKLRAEQNALHMRFREITEACKAASRALLTGRANDTDELGAVIEQLADNGYALALVPFEDLASPPKCSTCKAPVSSREPKAKLEAQS